MIIKLLARIGIWGHLLAWLTLILFWFASEPFARRTNPTIDLLAILAISFFVGSLVANIYLFGWIRARHPVEVGIYVSLAIQMLLLFWLVWLFGFSGR
jgi:hypothetical protein